jgi:hypothetical protein
MMDSGATHNFIREDAMQRLGLLPKPMQTSFKVVNLGIEKVVGIAKDVSLKLGE